jgi:DNA-binding response OmpR family regulator
MRLLVAEDDLAVGQNLVRTLQQSGYVVDWAKDGVTADDWGFVEPYDVIILDLGLPGKNGMDILQSWRSHGLHTPVLILTARSNWSEKVAGLKAGADDYLTKPFHNEELLARIQVLLRRSGTQVCSLACGALHLDEDAQQAVLNGEVIALTAMEFRMLRYFMLHPGRLIPAITLLEHSYDQNAETESNIVEVYISRLRRKLGKAWITTRRGQGYVFSPPQ